MSFTEQYLTVTTYTASATRTSQFACLKAIRLSCHPRSANI